MMFSSKFKSLFLFFALFFAITATAEATIVFDNSTFKLTGDTYIDTATTADTIGIGRVTTISEGSNIIWTSGQNGEYLNFVFGGFTTTQPPVAPSFNYVATGGFVNFFLTTDGTVFDTSVNSSTAITNISNSGSLFLSTIANGPTVGITTSTTYSSSGFLDVTGGAYAAQLDTNTRPTFTSGVFADLSFGVVGANNLNPQVNTDYAFISSTDAQGAAVVPVGEPATMFLMGLAILSFGLYKREQNNANLFKFNAVA